MFCRPSAFRQLLLGQDSNVIQLSEPNNKLEVARACSGLRMMTLFFAVCVAARVSCCECPFGRKSSLIVSACSLSPSYPTSPVLVLTGMLCGVGGALGRRSFLPRQGGLVHDALGDADDLGRDVAAGIPAHRGERGGAAVLWRRRRRFPASSVAGRPGPGSQGRHARWHP